MALESRQLCKFSCQSLRYAFVPMIQVIFFSHNRKELGEAGIQTPPNIGVVIAATQRLPRANEGSVERVVSSAVSHAHLSQAVVRKGLVELRLQERRAIAGAVTIRYLTDLVGSVALYARSPHASRLDIDRSLPRLSQGIQAGGKATRAGSLTQT